MTHGVVYLALQLRRIQKTLAMLPPRPRAMGRNASRPSIDEFPESRWSRRGPIRTPKQPLQAMNTSYHHVLGQYDGPGFKPMLDLLHHSVAILTKRTRAFRLDVGQFTVEQLANAIRVLHATAPFRLNTLCRFEPFEKARLVMSDDA